MSSQPLFNTTFNGQKWYDNESGLNETAERKWNHADEIYIDQIKRAEKLLKRDAELSTQNTRTSKKSEENWLSTIIDKGTLSDRLSAVQLKFQKAPLHSLDYLERFVAMLEKRKMRDAINLLKCLKVILVNELLPDNRKLIPFDMRPLDRVDRLATGNKMASNMRLILWLFEDKLKKLYERVCVAAQKLAANTVEGVAQQACITLADLLIERPEQEQFLLTALVNKMGHPKKQIDVTVTKQLERLINCHPNMRMTVAVELERLIFKKNMAERAQFYAVHTLTLIRLTSGDIDLALKLLRIYFSLFRILIDRKTVEKNARFLALVMRGANNAFPHAKQRTSELGVELDEIYKLVHTATKLSTSLSALQLLYQMLTYNTSLSDRFYTAFYTRMLRIRSTNADAQFFRLLFQALNDDIEETRIRAFIKRLMQMSLNNTPSFAASALLVYSKLIQEKPTLLRLPTDENAESTLMMEHGDATLNYDIYCRNPLFARAQLSTDTELVLLSRHYHPSVAHFAQCVIDNVPIVYKGNPLMDFTLMRFLDRFAFKNPKVYRPNDEDHAFARPKYQPAGVKKLAPGSEEYAKKRTHEIPNDERFLHRFASVRAAQKQKAAGEAGDTEQQNDDEQDEVSSVDSDDFDRIVSRFEPGELNEEFEWDEVDFAQEFGSELDPKLAKARRRQKRRSEAAAIKKHDENESGGGDDSDSGAMLDASSSESGGEPQSGDEDDDEEEDQDEDEEDESDEAASVDEVEVDAAASSDEEKEFKRKRLRKISKRGYQDDIGEDDDD